jgi:hypothetical protein
VPVSNGVVILDYELVIRIKTKSSNVKLRKGNLDSNNGTSLAAAVTVTPPGPVFRGLPLVAK